MHCVFMYRKSTMMDIYRHIIIPTTDPQLWSTNITHPINHPFMWRSIGWSNKNHNKVNDEAGIRNTLPRTLQIVKCKKCGSFNHNKWTCKGKRVPKRVIPKGGNKKTGKKGWHVGQRGGTNAYRRRVASTATNPRIVTCLCLCFVMLMKFVMTKHLGSSFLLCCWSLCNDQTLKVIFFVILVKLVKNKVMLCWIVVICWIVS